jgi:hypothetical protein
VLEGGAEAAPQVGEAVHELLAGARYAEAAGRIAADIRSLPPFEAAVGVLEAHARGERSPADS